MSEESPSAIEYLMTYGWILLVLFIVGGAIITTVNGGEAGSSDLRINASEVADYMESEHTFHECSGEVTSYDDRRADIDCSRSIDSFRNVSYNSGKEFTAELRSDGEVVIYQD